MTNFSAADVAHVTKFNGTNYPFWKFQVQMILELYQVCDVVMGNTKKPEIDSGNAVDDHRLESWNNRDCLARILIFSTLEENCKRTLLTCKTANEMWSTIASQHELYSQEHKQFWLGKFYEYVYQPGHDVESHISAIENLAYQLSDVGSPIGEIEIMAKIITTLPPSFKHMIYCWNHVQQNKTLPLLKRNLMSEEARNKKFNNCL